MSEISSSNQPQKRHLSGGEFPDIREKTRAKTTDSETMDIDPPTMSSSGPPVNVGIGPIIDNNKSPPNSDSGTEDLLDRNADIPLGFLHVVNTVLKKQFPQNKEVDNALATFILLQCYQLDALHRIGNLDLRKGAFDLVEEYPGIVAICQEAVRTGDFKNIFRLKPFQIAKIVPNETLHDTQLHEASKMATQTSWTEPFKGNAANALWTFLVDTLGKAWRTKRPNDNESSVAEPYAHFAAIVQSSGMGKSRVVDELAKTHFVIPINIRAAGSRGYPPSDANVRNFLCLELSDRMTIGDRCNAFLLALIEMTTDVLLGIPYKAKAAKNGRDHSPEVIVFDRQPEDTYETIAAKFREHMSDGMTFKSHGKKREFFYKAVIDRANKLMQSGSPISGNIQEESFAKLVAAINGGKSSVSTAQDDLIKQDQGPQVVIMFDEAHTLMVPEPVEDTVVTWTVFTELRRCLQSYRHLSLFTLFLSTTGKIDQFTPSVSRDLSVRLISRKLYLYRPFADLGFDQLAIKLKFNGNNDLSDIVTDKHIAHYGRPLWGSMLTSQRQGNSRVMEHIIDIAAMKLMGGIEYTDGMDLTKHQKLACLSQRLPIEFNSTNYVDQEKELQQVEGHMRVCLKVNAGFDKLVTVSPSEPILSEAAYFIMSSSKFDIPATLFNILGGFSVHKGDRGELLGMLLLVIARDQAVGPPMRFSPSPEKRWCLVPDFLSNLFHQPEKVLAAKGQFVGHVPQESYQLDEELRTTFADSKIYCSHFVKVHQKGCVNASYLMMLLARGAGILCANNHPGIDIVIPVLLEGTRLAVNNIGAMSIQIKNDSKYGHKPDLALFKQMDPYHTEIFTKECDIPIIRIVFALAAATPSLEIVHVPESLSGKHYKAYDIWAAGLSPDIFTPITRQNKDTWKALLDASYGWRDIYKDASSEELALRKMENPGAALEDLYWNNWWDKSAMFELQ